MRQAVGVRNARIYIDGMYGGTGLTRASARDGAQRMLVVYQKGAAAQVAGQGVPQPLALWAYRPSTKGDPSQGKIKISLKPASDQAAIPRLFPKKENQ